MSVAIAESRVASGVRDLMDRFRDVAARHPGRDAVVAPDGTTVGFGALDDRVRRLAGALAATGVRAGDTVGVCLERGPELLTALLAVWAAGAAYVPLDPAYPQARLDYMAADAGIRAVVCAERDRPWAAAISVLNPSDSRALPPAAAVAVPADAPAYVIYTSGSTGKPKGVAVSRENVARLVGMLQEGGVYPETPARVVWNASVSFDASVQQWARICRGDTILTLTEELRSDAAALAEYMVREQATDMDATPSHWSVLRDRVVDAALTLPQGVRLFIGGEAVPAAMWRDLAELGAAGTVRAVNLYGPTECTVDATAAFVEGAEPHIGPGLPGVGVHVLDDGLRPAEEGELYLTGPGLAMGYLGRPTLTSERFVASPFGAPGTRMYRTGDRVRLRPDGSLAYLGRVDHQVKVNGFRVELGEIEAVLAGHPAVAAAVVALREHPTLGRSLAAYWVPAAGAGTDPAPIREHLRTTLPEHLAGMPLTALDALPLGVGGKVDRNALPEPTAEQGSATEGEDPTPTGRFEESIAEAWREVLSRDEVLATDDFFALGGHSLVALRVVADLKKRYGVVIRTKTVYENPRLRDLAGVVAALVG